MFPPRAALNSASVVSSVWLKVPLQIKCGPLSSCRLPSVRELILGISFAVCHRISHHVPAIEEHKAATETFGLQGSYPMT
ncbi:hypothetical protein, partial [Escherichia coli]|uniref:hypothetical protein n=1 Tax=Escherichia coli TaxID=562 RepID=UPI0028DF90A7